MQKASKTVANSKPLKAQPEDFKSSKGKTKRVTIEEEDSESEDEPEREEIDEDEVREIEGSEREIVGG